MRLSTLLKQLPRCDATVPDGLADTEVTGVAYDSRAVRPGHVFVAIRGEKFDGHDYAADAVKRGAVAVVGERKPALSEGVACAVLRDARRALAVLSAAFYGHPSRRLNVIGITGTNGKTTVVQLLRSILDRAGMPCGALGTLGYDTGARRLPAPRTTPEAPEIQAFFAEMLSGDMRHAAMEVSSHALCLRRVDLVHFHAGVFTQLTQDHLDYHKTMEAYRDAKGRLFAQLGPAAFAVLNADDPVSAHFAERTSARVLWYGMNGMGDVRGRVIEAGLKGIRFELTTPRGKAEVASRLVGEHSVANALAAAAAAHTCGLDAEAIAEGLRHARIVNGRLHPVECGQPFDVLVDYAHTHHALETVLKAVRPYVKGRLILVFGAGGDRDRAKRPLMGQTAERFADMVWITSDNPRSENPLDIIEQIREGVNAPSRLHVQPDREMAIAEALSAAREGDAVIIAGKGHEAVQILRDRTVPFDDREVARRLLEGIARSRRVPA